MVADMKFQVNCMSPEEVVPIFYPQIYDVSDPQLSDEEFPAVSTFIYHFTKRKLIKAIFPFCNSWKSCKVIL